ncbi:MAG: S-layer homology domain-containing protein [Candidatus Limnocylindrales bacterium]
MSEEQQVDHALEARVAELERQLTAQDRRRVPGPRVSRHRLAAFVLALALVAVPGVVLANHMFPDVPTSNPFHDQISAIAGAGITAGFGDGGYHPADPVTRQSMAAFMQRGFGRTALAIGEPPITFGMTVEAGSSDSLVVPVRQLTITMPGANNAFSPQQMIHLQGRVSFSTSMSTSPKGCPCMFAAWIRDTTTNALSLAQYQTFESTTDEFFFYGFDVEALFAAAPGARTYQLEVRLNSRSNTTNEASFALDQNSSLSAMTFPFGPTGTSSF